MKSSNVVRVASTRKRRPRKYHRTSNPGDEIDQDIEQENIISDEQKLVEAWKVYKENNL